MDNLLKSMDFGNEAADDADPEELSAYFVEQKMFKEFLDPKQKMLIATAKKGVGKSALLKWAAHNISIKVDCTLKFGRFGLERPDRVFG